MYVTLGFTDLETNGIAERAARRVKEGTSAVLLQSGLNESWWADSMECYTYLRFTEGQAVFRALHVCDVHHSLHFQQVWF